jgi:maltooligosyltrehalose trehalohydrolase
MWVLEYRFDGLRLDAVHAIESPDFLPELAQRIRQQIDPSRHVWLTVENELNQSSLLEEDSTPSGTTTATTPCTCC